jgi:hypothetical protein
LTEAAGRTQESVGAGLPASKGLHSAASHPCGLLLSALLLALCTPAHAQDFSLDNLSFDGAGLDGASVGDDLFAEPADARPDWLRPFTFRLSQQFMAQINPHTVALPGGVTLARNAATENSRLSLLTRYQNAFAPGWLLQGSAQAKLYWPGDYEYRANNEKIDTEFRLNELFLQRSEGSQSLKLGAQTVVWGENVGNSVLDVINTSEYRDLSIIDIEDARLNQWLLVWDSFGTGTHLSSFVNLYPEFNPPPVRGSPFFFEPEFNLSDLHRDKPQFEIGSKMRWSFAGSDVSLMAAYLYENQLRYSAPASGMGDAAAQANDFLLLGFSTNRAIGKLLLNLDIAFSHDVLGDFVATSPLGIERPVAGKADLIAGTAGFEYAISNEQSLIAGVSAQTVLDQRLLLLPGERLVGGEVTGNVLLRYSNSLRNGDAVLAVTVQSALDAGSLLASVALNYTLSNHLALLTQVIATRADKETLAAFLDEDVRAGMTLTWSF